MFCFGYKITYSLNKMLNKCEAFKNQNFLKLLVQHVILDIIRKIFLHGS